MIEVGTDARQMGTVVSGYIKQFVITYPILSSPRRLPSPRSCITSIEFSLHLILVVSPNMLVSLAFGYHLQL